MREYKGGAAARFDSFCKPMASGCIEWTGSLNEDGYGTFRLGARVVKAHRASWMLAIGAIEERLLVLHRCDNPRCVNVEHLFLGTQTDNMRDMKMKGRGPDVTGAGNPRAKLTEADVGDVRRRHAAGESYAAIGRAYGVTRTAIRDICIGKRWAHVA